MSWVVPSSGLVASSVFASFSPNVMTNPLGDNSAGVLLADPAVVSATAHGYANGDRVRLYGTTTMLQISSMEFSVSAVSANAFTLAGMPADGANFAAATALISRRLPTDAQVAPEATFVTFITQAAAAVVTTSVLHNYVVGQLITFSVPTNRSAGVVRDMGMVEMNGLTGEVTAVTATTFTVDIDTQGFTAFLWPASSLNIKHAMCGPAGQRNTYDIDNVPFRSGIFIPYMHLGDNIVGANLDVYVWQATKMEN